MDDLTQAFNKLCTLVERMKANRQNVPLETLRSRYQKSYEALKEEISATGSRVFHALAVMHLQIKSEDNLEAWKQPLDEVYEAAKMSGLPLKLGDALAKYCDTELFMLYAMQFQNAFERRFYMAYWLEHTKVAGGAYYNDIIDMKYDPTSKCWMNEAGGFGIFWPPTKAEYEAYLEQNEKDIAEEIEKRTEPENIVICA